MNQEKRAIVEKYIAAYNNFETDEMLSLFAPDCTFENYSNNELTASAEGLAELRMLMEQSKNVFAARRQTVTKLTFEAETVIAEIDYWGKLNIDLPNGSKSGDELNLEGRSEFKFENDSIKSLKDFS